MMAGPPTATSPNSVTADPNADAACTPKCITGSVRAGTVPACAISRVMLLLATVVVLLAIDQASKLYAMQHWRPTALEPLSFLGGVFRIQYAENPGAFLSLFGGMDPQFRFWLFQVLNGGLLLGVAGFLLSGRWPPDLWQWSALAFILAGGIGNLIDRIRFDNHVIDFLILSTGPLAVPFFGEVRTGIFNVADIAITGGFLMLLPVILRPGESSESVPAPRTAA